MSRDHSEESEEPVRIQRMFGFFAFVAIAGLAYSLIAQPAASRRAALANGAIGVDAEETLAYASCQASVRASEQHGASLHFPETAENFGDAGGNHWAVVARVVVDPAAGAPFAQRFVCRMQHVGAGRASVWRVAHLSLESPES